MASRALRRRSSYRAINSHRKDKPRPLLRLALVLFVLLTMLTSGASAATLLLYGNNLPSLKNFESRFDFQNTRILDTGNHVLFNLADLSKGRGRRVVEPLISLDHPTSYFLQQHVSWLVGTDAHYGIPIALQNATVATEDATFYSNPGFDPLSILRAEFDNLTTGHIVSGASTITQQLIKKYLLTDDPSISRKIEEVVLAAELTQKYPKTEILWYYLNSVPYGNLSIGAQAAARTYFNTNVWDLDPAQCAFLAGLPEAPSTYNPIGNLPAALNRMRYVLHLMYIHGYLVDASGRPDPSLVDKYMAETKGWKFSAPKTRTRFPQFVAYAIDQLQQIPNLQGKIYSGLDVYTTLDAQAQQTAQKIVTGQINSLGSYNVSDGALVSLDLRPGCYGCIRAMVGSADYNAPGGQINMANTPRQPGSSFKPFNYIYAFEHGVGPATWVDDDPIAIPDVGNPEDGGVYTPTDYDHQWHGTVTLRVALQNSLNVPAVRVEQYDASVGGSIWKTVRAQAIKQGITSFDKDNNTCCGWALTLGGMPRGVRLVEETAAYGAFATGGFRVQPVAIRKVVDRSTGKVLYDATDTMQQEMHAARVIGAPYAYVMNNVLSDDQSRCTPQVCEFGIGSDLAIPGRTVAAKTGTTNSFTDNWTVGYTPQIVTGVWVGNADNSPMVGTTGITGAAPIWHQYMLWAFQHFNLPPVDFQQPPSGVYYGSACQLATGSGTVVSTFNYDLWAETDPLCNVGGASGNIEQTGPAVPQQAPAYTPPAPAAPVAPTTAPTPVVAAPPVVATAVPQQAPPQAPPAQPPPVQQPTPVVLAPTQPAPPVTQPTVAAPPVVQPTAP